MLGSGIRARRADSNRCGKRRPNLLWPTDASDCDRFKGASPSFAVSCTEVSELARVQPEEHDVLPWIGCEKCLFGMYQMAPAY